VNPNIGYRRYTLFTMSVVLLAATGGLVSWALKSQAPRYPDSPTYTIAFTWDGSMKRLAVQNDRTRSPERNQALLRAITAEAEKSIPRVAEQMGLGRVEGELSCNVIGIEGLYRFTCAPSSELGSDEFDPDAKAPLMVAARSGNAKQVRDLLKSNSNADARDQHGTTALMLSFRTENTQVLEQLIAAGAAVNARDLQGQTALRLAVDADNTEAVRLLLDSGADPNTPDNKGWTPLMNATTPEVAQALIKRGANVNATNCDGETALMIAAEFGSPDLVKTLLAAHPELGVRSKAGHTALDLAKSMGKRDVARLLASRAPTPNG